MAKFTFFENWAEIFDALPDEQYLAISRALYRYGCNGVEPTFAVGTMEWVVWTAIKPNVDASQAKRENGSKGGRPKKTNSETTEKTLVKTTDKTSGESDKEKDRNRNRTGIGEEEEVSFSQEKKKPSSNASVSGAAVADATPQPSAKKSHPRCRRCRQLVSAKSDGSGMFVCTEHGELHMGEVFYT